LKILPKEVDKSGQNMEVEEEQIIPIILKIYQ